MTQEQYLVEFESKVKILLDLTRRKNADYASASDALANFRAIEILSSGDISAHEGILVRMTDKLQRIINLSQRETQVKDESIEDTLDDLAVYALILSILLKEKREKQKGTNPTN